ncbi:MAG TPA: GNAT family protein [Flavisolibacter sp.]|nr:GNAT family protein [Flavisolibacter sp.]
MHLRRYQPPDFALLAQWVTSPELLFQFAGTDFTFPLTSTQLDVYQAAHPDRLFYVACLPNNKPFAFGEIIPQDTNTPRLGRLLVGDTAKRGKGLGAIFVQLLVDECIRLFHCKHIELYVLRDNVQARRCYEKVGFSFVADASFQLIGNDETYTIDKMRLDVG